MVSKSFKEADYSSSTKLFDEVNVELNERFECLCEDFMQLRMNELLWSILSHNPKLNHYFFFYHDNIHLRFHHDIIFRKNLLLMFLLQTST